MSADTADRTRGPDPDAGEVCTCALRPAPPAHGSPETRALPVRPGGRARGTTAGGHRPGHGRSRPARGRSRGSAAPASEWGSVGTEVHRPADEAPTWAELVREQHGVAGDRASLGTRMCREPRCRGRGPASSWAEDRAAQRPQRLFPEGRTLDGPGAAARDTPGLLAPRPTHAVTAPAWIRVRQSAGVTPVFSGAPSPQ